MSDGGSRKNPDAPVGAREPSGILAVRTRFMRKRSSGRKLAASEHRISLRPLPARSASAASARPSTGASSSGIRDAGREEPGGAVRDQAAPARARRPGAERKGARERPRRAPEVPRGREAQRVLHRHRHEEARLLVSLRGQDPAGRARSRSARRATIDAGKKKWTFAPLTGVVQRREQGRRGQLARAGVGLPDERRKAAEVCRRSIANGLGRYVIVLDNEYVIHSPPPPDSPLKGREARLVHGSGSGPRRDLEAGRTRDAGLRLLKSRDRSCGSAPASLQGCRE